MLVSLLRVTVVDELALGEQEEAVEEVDNVGLWLMYGENDSAVEVFGERCERGDDVVRVVGVQT